MTQHDESSQADAHRQAASADPEAGDAPTNRRPLLIRLVRQFGRFGFASGASLLAILGLTFVFHDLLHRPGQWAYGLALVLVFVANFLVLRFWVYREIDSDSRMTTQFVQVAGLSAVFRGLEYLGFLGLFGKLGWGWLPAVLVVSVVSFVLKFFVYRQVMIGRPRQREASSQSQG